MFHLNTLLDGRLLNAEPVISQLYGEGRVAEKYAEQKESNQHLVNANAAEHRRMVEDGFDTTDRIVPLIPFQYRYTFTVTPCTDGEQCNVCHP